MIYKKLHGIFYLKTIVLSTQFSIVSLLGKPYGPDYYLGVVFMLTVSVELFSREDWL